MTPEACVLLRRVSMLLYVVCHPVVRATSALLGLACGRVVSEHAVQLAEGGAGDVERHPAQDGQEQTRQQQRAAVSQLRQLLWWCEGARAQF